MIDIQDENTRKKCFANPKLDLQKAIDIISIEKQVEKDSECLSSKNRLKPSCIEIGQVSRAKYKPMETKPNQHTIQPGICCCCGKSNLNLEDGVATNLPCLFCLTKGSSVYRKKM